MGRVIYIAGPMKLQNVLTAAYLEEVTGVPCEAVEDVSDIPCPGDETGTGKRLILWDCMGKDLQACMPELSGHFEKGSDCDYLCLINLLRDEVFEEKNLPAEVRGFFYREDSVDQLLKGIEIVFRGELWLSRRIMTNFILKNHRQESPGKEDAAAILTRREKEILTMVREGATNCGIADKLCISNHTVKTHLYNIFKKIDVCSRLQAAFWAARNLPPSP